MRVLTVGKRTMVRALAFAADGRLVVSADNVQPRVWSPARKTPRLLGGAVGAIQLHFVPGGVLAAGAGFGVQRFDDDGTQRVLTSSFVWLDGPALDVSPDGSRFVTLTAGLKRHALECRSTTDGSFLWAGGEHAVGRRHAGVCFTPDGRRLVLLCNAHPCVYAAEHCELLAEWPTPARPPIRGYRAAFRPDGTLLAISQGDGISILDADTGRERGWLPAGDEDRFAPVAFSADGRVLAAGTDRGLVRMWDANTWRERPAFEPGVRQVLSLAFSPDGALAAAGGFEQVAVWDWS